LTMSPPSNDKSLRELRNESERLRRAEKRERREGGRGGVRQHRATRDKNSKTYSCLISFQRIERETKTQNPFHYCCCCCPSDCCPGPSCNSLDHSRVMTKSKNYCWQNSAVLVGPSHRRLLPKP
jgi:hypothetical protein